MSVLMLGGLFYWYSQGECSYVKDATSAWNLHYSRPFTSLFCGLLAISIQGEINGSAALQTPAGTMHLTGGRINKMLLVHEYWNSKCDLQYDPGSVTSGSLTVTISLGGSPSWVQRPLLDVEPVNYTGGWRTWHPEGMQIRSEGFYRNGKKDGKWMYWDGKGIHVSTEVWRDGHLISTGQE